MYYFWHRYSRGKFENCFRTSILQGTKSEDSESGTNSMAGTNGQGRKARCRSRFRRGRQLCPPASTIAWSRVNGQQRKARCRSRQRRGRKLCLPTSNRAWSKANNKEVEEIMVREDLWSWPTLERTEEAYVRNKNNSIVHKLCVVLELEDPEEIMRSVAELIYFK
jgi:hypothetical protein